MPSTIPLYDTISGLKIALVDPPKPMLLQERYFPTQEPLDLYDSKAVFVDIDKGDFKRAAFFSCGYGSAETMDWTADSVIPPRVAVEDRIDPCTGKDRVIFEQLCRPQGTLVPSHADALNALLELKSSRLVDRASRSIESLAALVLSENGVNIAIENAPDDPTTRDVRINYWYKGNGTSSMDPGGSTVTTNPQIYKSTLWSQTGATPYDDVINMCIELERHGTIPEDLLLSQAAWKKLEDDLSSRGMMMPWQSHYTVIANGDGVDGLFNRSESGARYVAKVQFGGYVLNVIVYNGAYENDSGVMVPYFDQDFVCVTRPRCGHTVCGAVSLPNYSGIFGVDGNRSTFTQRAGKYILSQTVNLITGQVFVRCESNPLPAPLWPWAWITLKAND